MMYAGLDATFPTSTRCDFAIPTDLPFTTDGYGMINSMSLIEFNTKVPPFDNPPRCAERFPKPLEGIF